MAAFLDDVYAGAGTNSFATPSPLFYSTFIEPLASFQDDVDWRDGSVLGSLANPLSIHTTPLDSDEQVQCLFQDLQALAESPEMEQALVSTQPTLSSKRQQIATASSFTSDNLNLLPDHTVARPLPKRAKSEFDAALSPTSTYSDALASVHSDSDCEEPELDRIVCPVCGGAGRNSARRICGVSFSSVYVSVSRWLSPHVKLCHRHAIRAYGTIARRPFAVKWCQRSLVIMTSNWKSSERVCQHTVLT
jgi:hypothetical protein